MKKILKITGYTILTILVLLYLSFLFVLPNVIDLSQYKTDLQNIVKEQSRLSLNYDNMKLITTPSLAVGVKADNITVLLPDTSLLFSAKSIKTAVSLPHLILYKLNIPFVDVKNPVLNAEIMKNGEDYKLVKLIENIINDKKEESFGKKPVVEEKTSFFDFSSMKLTVDKVLLKDYKILITDLSSKHYLDLHGDSFIFGYYNSERIKLKTKAELFSDENKNAVLNLNLNTFLPEGAPKLDSEDDPAEKVDFLFVNPVKTYQNYDLKADINAKLKINKDKNNNITSYGYINADDITLKISTVQIPKSYVKLKTFGSKVDFDTDLYTHENENLKIFGSINNFGADINVKTEQIKLTNLLELLKAYAKSLNIPNEFSQYKVQGTITADCSAKTNFKKFVSKGYVKVENGGVALRRLGKILSKININLFLDDNVLDFGNSELYIGNSPVKISGLIDNKSFADINIITKDVPLPLLFNAFAPKQLRNSYNFKSGNLSSFMNIKGKINEAPANFNISLNNFYFEDRAKSFMVKNKLIKTSLNYSLKNQKLSGIVNNDNLLILFPKTASKLTIPLIEAEIKEDDIDLKQNVVKFNDKTELTYFGAVKDYKNLQNIDFSLGGKLNTDDIINFIGKEMKPLINSKGSVPFEIKLNGSSKKQTLLAHILADSDNYITPVDIKALKDLKTSLQTTIDFKPNRIKIKDTGLYTRASVLNENNEETIVTNKIIGIDGTIENDRINLIKADIPKELEGKFFVFPKSSFNIDNGILFIYGKTAAPLIRGSLKVKDIKIPEIFSKISDVDLNFKSDELNFNLNKIVMLSSDLDIKGKLSLLQGKTSDIYDFIINSNNFKVEDSTKVSQTLEKYMPKKTSSSSSKENDIPVSIHNGNLNMKKIQTGNILLTNTKSNLNLHKNILALKRFSTEVFDGKTFGNIFVNLSNMIINTELKGNGINIAKMLEDSAGIKDSLSGTASYTADLEINAANESVEAQMKGIKGDVDFNVTDGQFGPFGRLENLILAENIRESEFFQTALGGIIDSLATIDTTHFSQLKGHISFKDGNCIINPVTSNGNVMNLHIFGNFNLIKNYADMKVRVKLTSIVSDMLGPLNAINPVNLINNAASLNIVTAKAFSIFCETVPEEEMKVMPKFSNAYVDASATKFQLGVRGDAAKPLTLIKSFKWLASKEQFNKAKEFVESLPDVDEENITETVEEAENLEVEKKTVKYKVKHIFKK